MSNLISLRTILSGVILAFSLLFSFYIISSAQNVFDIQFPVPELGNCGSMEECKIYCDDSANARTCNDWAVSKGVAQAPARDEYNERSKETIERKEGPGGCRGQQECDAFCSQPEHNEECFNFAKENNLLPQEEIERIEKEMNQEGPGGCRSMQECDNFCRQPDNAKTCLDFSVQEGKITQEEADFMVQRTKMNQSSGGQRGPRPEPPRPGQPQGPQIDEEKAKQLLETVGGPGGCKTMDECEVFCDAPENDDTCSNFAVEHGLMPPQELERMKKLKETPGPGGCRGRATCDAYCDNIDHAEECMQFAVDQGFMDKNQVEEAKKFIEIGRRGGPGGCKGQRECDAFCNQPEHGEECFNFAKDNGLMPPEEIQKMEQERGIIKKLEQQGGGPGGCKGPEECRNYCMDTSHFDECAAFSVKEGMISPDKAQTMLREFVDVGERKFERFGPPGFGPQGFGPQQGQGSQQGQQGMMVGSSTFQERFKVFEQYQQGFQQRDDFCSKPENAEQCRQPGPGGPMMQFQPGQPGMMSPSEFPGQPEEFPGQQPYNNFNPSGGEQFMSPEEMMQYPGGPPVGETSGERITAPPQGMTPMQGEMPSGGMIRPPEGGMTPLEPAPSEPPTSLNRVLYLFGSIFNIFR